MRLTWHEAIVKEDQLIIRWPTEEKRLRTLIFIPIFALVVGATQALMRALVDRQTLQTITPISLIITGIIFATGCALIWFTKLWVIDRKRNVILQGGWQQMARLDDFSQIVIQREKRDGEIVYLLMAESENKERSLTMCLLDPDDARTIGKQLAHFARVPLIDR